MNDDIVAGQEFQDVFRDWATPGEEDRSVGESHGFLVLLADGVLGHRGLECGELSCWSEATRTTAGQMLVPHCRARPIQEESLQSGHISSQLSEFVI